ncbi:hypothetical protein [Rhodococcus sp. IEGM 1307]|uniref:hypothetical protein n=1 Tax=Rhodococcus sp. IEGM 1307 TaxID=3047091 RepID=UPI0024B6AC9F|nr:hypothetical protein [Rhodococcus sp. IEGM 1307]MDI9979823.1 hypothetical protein [Rhodococcus sp. IEGM 1307]
MDHAVLVLLRFAVVAADPAARTSDEPPAGRQGCERFSGVGELLETGIVGAPAVDRGVADTQ